MKAIRIAATAAIFAIGVTAASATDLMSDSGMSGGSMSYPMHDGFDWDGFYFGVYGGAEVYTQPSPSANWQVGKLVGVNFVLSDDFLIGFEAQGEAYFVPGSGFVGTQAFLMARAGLIVSDDLLLYATAGVGRPFPTGGGPAPNLWRAGGGIEWAVGDEMSIRGEIAAEGCMSGPILCLPDTWLSAKTALIWHLD